MKTISVIAGDSVSTKPLLEGAQRNRRDEAGDDGFKMVPQPGFDQEDDRQQYPNRLK
jgi:hypothetical protein